MALREMRCATRTPIDIASNKPLCLVNCLPGTSKVWSEVFWDHSDGNTHLEGGGVGDAGMCRGREVEEEGNQGEEEGGCSRDGHHRRFAESSRKVRGKFVESSEEREEEKNRGACQRKGGNGLGLSDCW